LIDIMNQFNELNSGIEWFLSHCADHRKLSPHTLKAYTHDLNHFLKFLMNERESEIQPPTINRDIVRRWLGSMTTAKPRTVPRRLAVVKSMFASFERYEKTPSNPIAGLRNEVKIGFSLPRTIARSAVRSLLSSTRQQIVTSPNAIRRKTGDMAIVELLFASGMRVSEAVATNIGHIDMQRLSISVRGKGNREREIPIVCDAFREALEAQIIERKSSGAGMNDPVFVNRRGARMSDQSIRAVLRRHASVKMGLHGRTGQSQGEGSVRRSCDLRFQAGTSCRNHPAGSRLLRLKRILRHGKRTV
jgi:site-specific recombinase XerD